MFQQFLLVLLKRLLGRGEAIYDNGLARPRAKLDLALLPTFPSISPCPRAQAVACDAELYFSVADNASIAFCFQVSLSSTSLS